MAKDEFIKVKIYGRAIFQTSLRNLLGEIWKALAQHFILASDFPDESAEITSNKST